jgi:hypothetical protein
LAPSVTCWGQYWPQNEGIYRNVANGRDILYSDRTQRFGVANGLDDVPKNTNIVWSLLASADEYRHRRRPKWRLTVRIQSIFRRNIAYGRIIVQSNRMQRFVGVNCLQAVRINGDVHGQRFCRFFSWRESTSSTTYLQYQAVQSNNFRKNRLSAPSSTMTT